MAGSKENLGVVVAGRGVDGGYQNRLGAITG